uniref:CCR4-Not complex component Not1 C-terminal domain-containing protein n=1 Tax=Meloidogyne incognita TaxID=6306 RepID=A0A914N1J9_MELIC
MSSIKVIRRPQGCGRSATRRKYLLFNAIANQLRYPNSHTHYFSCTMLYLFLEANSEQIQEQITRILFERLVALRPHPWGLLITFIELIRNPRYNFWKHDFVRCAPEIERFMWVNGKYNLI